VRIVGGRWAGRDLTSPADARVRPTSELVRARLLDLLEPHLDGARVLDLFAGTGALGLEALSRGARSADFVETRPSSLHALKANIAALRVRERTRVFKRDAIPFAAALPAGAYDIAFADPPYGSRMLDRIVEAWKSRPFARILAAEHARGQAVPPGGTLHRFGADETAVTIYRLRGAKAASPGDAAAERAAPRPGRTPQAPPRTDRHRPGSGAPTGARGRRP
jgi:16S rRNA (guanine966-N2)-methyltransferase